MNQLGCVGVSLSVLATLAGSAMAGEPCPDCVIEVHAIADAALFAQLGSGTEDYIRDVIEGMDAVWSMPTSSGGMGVGVVLSEFTFNEKSDPWVVSTDSTVLLPNVRSYANTAYPMNADGRDVVLMFSGLDFDGNTTGLSYIGGLCGPSAVGILESAPESLAFAISGANHQLGHIAGSVHDGSGNACAPFDHIMAAASSPSFPPATFSSCSIAYFADLVSDPFNNVPACLVAPASVCPADLTGDDALNFLDVSAFLSAFGNQEPVADFEADGNFNFLDVSAFLAAFGAGCP